ncbi:MAG: LuxR C-terminal-related transcriptional regulator [Planctomycetota bacterium]
MISGDGLCGVDREQRIVLWNAAAQALLGYSFREVRGRFCYEILGGADETGCRVCRYRCANFSHAQRNEPIRTKDLLVRAKSGKALWLAVSTMLPPDPLNGKAVLIHLLRDIDRLKTFQLGVEHLVECAGSSAWKSSQPQGAEGDGSGSTDALTRREREILGLLASGTSTRQIAATLVVSPATVRNHVNNILGKMQVHSRLEAVSIALRNGLL